MNYHNLFPSTSPIKIGLIGTGHFGNSFLFQMRSISRLHPVAICDINVDAAREACLAAGWPEDSLSVCTTDTAASDAVAAGHIVLTDDASVIMGTPFDVLVEATGIPEAGAAHALAAIEHGKHVVNVSKETDCTVGPILSHLAAERGLVYTLADGDQPSMLIRLISWAQTLGLQIIAAGKSSESDMIYDVGNRTIEHRTGTVSLDTRKIGADGVWDAWTAEGGMEATVAHRRETLSAIPLIAVPDLCEMAMVMNATGMGYDAPTLHAPVVRITELPDVWATRSDGGILHSTGVIDTVNCLRRSDEVSLAGGVWVVFECHDEPTWQLLREKGHLVSRDLRRGAVFLPYHLLGVETATSILAAADLGQPTSSTMSVQRVDLCVIATKPLHKGDVFGMSPDHVLDGVRPELMPAKPMAPDAPIPYYMAAQNVLSKDVPEGAVVTYDMVQEPDDSVLWSLRRRQDAMDGG